MSLIASRRLASLPSNTLLRRVVLVALTLGGRAAAGDAAPPPEERALRAPFVQAMVGIGVDWHRRYDTYSSGSYQASPGIGAQIAVGAEPFRGLSLGGALAWSVADGGEQATIEEDSAGSGGSGVSSDRTRSYTVLVGPMIGYEPHPGRGFFLRGVVGYGWSWKSTESFSPSQSFHGPGASVALGKSWNINEHLDVELAFRLQYLQLQEGHGSASPDYSITYLSPSLMFGVNGG
jgi:hypothetical protein